MILFDGGEIKDSDGTNPGNQGVEGQRANAIYSVQGIQFVHRMNPFLFNTTPSFAAAQSGVSVIAAPAAGLSLYITDIYCQSDTSGSVQIFENTTTTQRVTFRFSSGGGNAGHSYVNPIRFANATELKVTTSMTVSTLVINGFTAP